MNHLIHSPLEHYAESTPDAVALSFDCEHMSYRELNEKSNQLAHFLLSHKVEVEERVGIFLHKGFDLGVAIYGILKAGCAFVPLDPMMPTDRLAFILDDCNIKQLISSDALTTSLTSLGAVKTDLRLIGVEASLPFTQANWSEVQTYSTANPDLPLIDQILGYIMYTSGSTGSPKGMMHTHSGSNCYAEWGKNHVQLDASDRVASHAPLHFDLSIFDFFSTLRAGATVVLVPEAVTRFPASWTQTIEAERITVVFTVPYTLITMVEKGAIEKRDLSSLRWILFGGEPYAPRQLRQLIAALPGVKLTNVYGPAEAPSCTCYDVPIPYPDSDSPLPIGYVSRNSMGLIIDEEGHECGSDEAGELCIRSSTLTRGYWNRPDLNEHAFHLKKGYGPFPHIFYRTGDRVIKDDTGILHFLGRMDRMVKTRGHRVELDEVEATLLKIEGIVEGAAYVIPDTSGSVQIMADVTVAENSSLEQKSILQHLRAQLPAYALPRAIRIAKDLPHTSSGKIDRKALAINHTIFAENSQQQANTGR